MKAQKRYRLRTEPDGSWSVIDVFTGLPVICDEQPVLGVDQQQAVVLATQFNLLEIQRHKDGV